MTVENIDTTEHLARNISEKIEIERAKQDEVFRLLQSTYNDIQSDLQDGAMDIVNIINRHVRSTLADSFSKFTNQKEEGGQSRI